MYEFAGKSLADRIRAFCGKNKTSIIRTFYYPNIHLSYRSPYELCSLGRQEDVSHFVSALEQDTSSSFFLDPKQNV